MSKDSRQGYSKKELLHRAKCAIDDVACSFLSVDEVARILREIQAHTQIFIDRLEDTGTKVGDVVTPIRTLKAYLGENYAEKPGELFRVTENDKGYLSLDRMDGTHCLTCEHESEYRIVKEPK
jgi:hypothetical protein